MTSLRRKKDGNSKRSKKAGFCFILALVIVGAIHISDSQNNLVHYSLLSVTTPHWPIIVANTTDILVKQLQERSQHHQGLLLDIVVSFVDSSYLGVLRIWLHYYTQHYRPHRVLCLVALDDECFERLLQIHNISPEGFGGKVALTKMNVFQQKGDKQQQQQDESRLWAERVRFLDRMLNELPHNLLFSDVDAIWLQDPQRMLDKQPNSDIVASRGLHPRECPLNRRDTICFGFSYFRNTPAFRYLSHKLVQDIDSNNVEEEGFDDQTSVNCMLFRNYTLKTEKNGFGGNTQLYYSEDNLKVSLLSRGQVLRRCGRGDRAVDKVKDLIVAHCSATHSGLNKIKRLRALNLVPADMVNIATDALWYTKQTRTNLSDGVVDGEEEEEEKQRH